MKLVALQSVVNATVSSLSGFSIPPRPRRFHRARRGVPFASSPVIVRPRVHPPLSFTSSSAHFLSETCPIRRPGTFHGVPSLIATSTSGVHLAVGFPGPPTVRPQRFSRSRRVTPPLALGVCFAPLPRPGFALQGFSPPPSRLGSSPLRALLPFPPFACRRFDPPAPARDASPSGRFSGCRSVTPAECLAPTLVRSPRVLLLPRVSCASAWNRPSPVLRP